LYRAVHIEQQAPLILNSTDGLLESCARITEIMTHTALWESIEMWGQFSVWSAYQWDHECMRPCGGVMWYHAGARWFPIAGFVRCFVKGAGLWGAVPVKTAFYRKAPEWRS